MARTSWVERDLHPGQGWDRRPAHWSHTQLQTSALLVSGTSRLIFFFFLGGGSKCFCMQLKKTKSRRKGEGELMSWRNKTKPHLKKHSTNKHKTPGNGCELPIGVMFLGTCPIPTLRNEFMVLVNRKYNNACKRAEICAPEGKFLTSSLSKDSLSSPVLYQVWQILFLCTYTKSWMSTKLIRRSVSIQAHGRVIVYLRWFFVFSARGLKLIWCLKELPGLSFVSGSINLFIRFFSQVPSSHN